MQRLLLAVFFIFANICFEFSNAAPDKVVCYVGSWSVYRPGDGKFVIGDIPPKICTHIIYSFVSVTADAKIKVLDTYADLATGGGLGGFQKVNNLKRANPNLKTLVAMGGWNEGSTVFSQVFSTPASRKTFALNAAAFVKTNGFNGLDMDWEYPAQRGGSPKDKANFIELLKVSRIEFDKSGLLLTAAVPANEKSFLISYDVPNIAKYLNFINIMTYDFHLSSEPQTGHNGPLSISNVEKNTPNTELNVDASIRAWIKNGAPATKLVLGVGLYGRSYNLSNLQCIGPRCPSTGPGAPGPFTSEAGMLGYNEICKIEPNSRMFFDNEAKVPYLVNGNSWVSYDNQQSAQLKVDYIKQMNLGGAMVWSMDTDDFKGTCGKGRYPVLTTLSKGIRGVMVSGSGSTQVGSPRLKH